MLRHKCPYCGWSITLRADELRAAKTESGGQRLHTLRCPKCRKVNKIDMRQIERALPPEPPASPAQETP